MSKNTYIIISICAILGILSALYYTGSRVLNDSMNFSNTNTGLISDLASPFGSGDSSKTLFDATPTQPTWETSSGTTVFFNTNWIGRTIEIQGKPVHYQFGSGNPIEFDKSAKELIEMNEKCFDYSPSLCDERTISLNGEFISVSKKEDGTFEDSERKPARMTPEIEYLVYSFLSNPIIRQSSESCAEYFFTYGQAYSVFGPGVGEILDTNWWSPYRIDINDIIVINLTTGRKELNLERISTLNTQLQIPSELQGGQYYTNVPLRECLQKNNQLNLLQSHVASHYERLRQLWSGQ